MSEETEILEPDRPTSRGARKGTAVLAAVAVGVVAVLGGSAYAGYQLFFAGGPQPAEVLPASTLGVLTIDLDPAAGQKVEAIRTIRKFPKLKEELGLDADEDLRRLFFDEMIESNDCDDLDYDTDIEPWVGKRAAFAAVDLGDEVPSPVIALQVTDQERAEDGFAKVVACAAFGEDFGFTVTADYLIASDSVAHAEAVVAEAADEPLSADAGYQKWTGDVGEAGVVSFYVDEAAAEHVVGLFGEASGRAASDDERALVEEALATFTGLAGTVRFADGGMELAVVGGGVDQYTGTSAVGGQVADLPGDTAAVLGFSVPDDFVQQVLDQVRNQLGNEIGADIDDEIEAFEAETGLEVPEDVQALLGDSVTVSLGGNAPGSLNEVEGLADVPVGLVVTGDPERIAEVIDKIEQASGASLDEQDVVRKSEGDRLALASSADYADAILGDGDLGVSESFDRAVPEADRAASLFYLDFDSAWVTSIIDTFGDDTGSDTTELTENLEPLEALGISGWEDGDVTHFLLKLTTD